MEKNVNGSKTIDKGILVKCEFRPCSRQVIFTWKKERTVVMELLSLGPIEECQRQSGSELHTGDMV